MRGLIIKILALPTFAALLLTLSRVFAPAPNVLYDYQTLLAGFLALGSALWAGKLLREQIAQAERLEKERIGSKRETARAMLPMSLAELTSYADECGQFVIAFGNLDKGGKLVDGAPPLQPPALPKEALLMLKELAEFVEPDQRLFIARLISAIQILSARLASVPTNPRSHPQPTLDEYLIDAAEARARAEAFYEWARHEDGATFPEYVAWQSLFDAAHSMQLHGRVADPERVEATILRRAKGDLGRKLRDR